MPYILATKVIMHSFSWFLETCPLLKEGHKPSNCLYPPPTFSSFWIPDFIMRANKWSSWESKLSISVPSLSRVIMPAGGVHTSYVSLTLSLLPSLGLDTHQQSPLSVCFLPWPSQLHTVGLQLCLTCKSDHTTKTSSRFLGFWPTGRSILSATSPTPSHASHVNISWQNV